MSTQTSLDTVTYSGSKPLIDLKNIRKKKVNLAIFGHGNVGGKLIDQIVGTKEEISKRRDLDITIFAIANSSSLLLQKEGVDSNWRQTKNRQGGSYTLEKIWTYAKNNNLENLVAVDNTASNDFVLNYTTLIANGFNLISSNKIGNTIGLDFYTSLREQLAENKKEYLYETNVGAGLPLIDTIKLLHLSGENITRIKGVFSGSLSYLFNNFSGGDLPFSEVLLKAIEKGFTEPDPREDLCGNDVGRKLLILARELDLHNEFLDVKIQNLIPKHLQNVTKEDFLQNLHELDTVYEQKEKAQLDNHVLRYVGELHGDLSKNDGAILEVNLVSVAQNSMLGQVSGSDSIFEIYTENYRENPIVIQGAGAGATVTARGVFGDILRLSDKLN